MEKLNKLNNEICGPGLPSRVYLNKLNKLNILDKLNKLNNLFNLFNSFNFSMEGQRN